MSSPEEMQQAEIDARQREAAARASLSRGHSSRKPVDLLDQLNDGELYETLTNPDLESEEFEGLEDVLAPFLSSSDMLAAHGEDYYNDRSLRLLNENLADRVTRGRQRGDLLTGPFAAIAQECDGDDYAGERRQWTAQEREAIRSGLAETRTNRQSLGDGTFLRSMTDIHVSSEVRHRDDGTKDSKSGGLLSLLPGF